MDTTVLFIKGTLPGERIRYYGILCDKERVPLNGSELVARDTIDEVVERVRQIMPPTNCIPEREYPRKSYFFPAAARNINVVSKEEFDKAVALLNGIQ